MAIYTKLTGNDIRLILSNYSIGDLENFTGIHEGIENTNYFLLVSKKKYILTIYEKRVKKEDLPFFSELMSGLNQSGFKCPVPILNNNNNSISEFKNKKLMIVSFVEGRAKNTLSPDNCKSVGIETAKMHEITKKFNIKRQNDLSIKSWRKIFNSVQDECSNIHKDLPKVIEINLNTHRNESNSRLR